MLRKLALIAAATASLALTALAPTTASADGRGHHGVRGQWGHNQHWRAPHFAHRPHYRPYVFGYGGNSCIRARWVPTPWGPQLRRVNVCR